jgi:hypothetical protein
MGRAYADGNPEATGKHWGTYSAATELPNTSSGVHSASLMLGDLASVGGELYVCTAFTGSGAATWTSQPATGGVAVFDDLTVTTDLQVDGNSVYGGTLEVVGATYPTGGIAGTSPIRITTIPIGAVALASLGTSTTPVSGTIYVCEFWLPSNKTLVGGAFLNGSAVGTNAAIVALYSAAGVLLANSALAGVVTANINTFQEIAFTAPYAAVGPAKYFLAYQTNGTTTRLRTIATATYLNTASATAGVFGTLGAITPPTTTTADTGPIGYVYSAA